MNMSDKSSFIGSKLVSAYAITVTWMLLFVVSKITTSTS